MAKSAFCVALSVAALQLGFPAAAFGQKPVESSESVISVPDAGLHLLPDLKTSKPKNVQAQEKFSHLLKAIEHLRRAGEPELANQVRTKLEKSRKTVLIAAKLQEIKRLQDEVAVLQRQLAAGKQVMLHLQVMEASIGKLRQAGVDGDVLVKRLISGEEDGQIAPLTGERVQQLVKSLRERKLLRVLAEPTLVTVSGRPVSFQSGGEIPIPVPQGAGQVSIEYRNIGTRIDCVPVVLDDGRLRVELRPSITQVDDSRSVKFNGTKIPGLRTRMVDTAMEMEVGQTMYLGGMVQERTTDSNNAKPEQTTLLIGVRAEWTPPLNAQKPTRLQSR